MAEEASEQFKAGGLGAGGGGEGGEVNDGSFVTLVSSDGHEFIVSRKVALTSGTIKSMLNSGEDLFEENKNNEVVFREISSHILERVCIYFYYNQRFANFTGKEIPEFNIPIETALELLMASNFLDT